jgi:tetratricopeptide (TPR) repeat protein/TolB-like protein/tRNA A-37 threonylcarbamoyl transferase component Bud32
MSDSRDDETFAATTPYGEEGPPAPPEDQTLRSGDLVADRYRIVRFIARGGMGEVYEAEDRELRARVALKTIRPEIAADPAMMERFRREIHLAHKVTHPNVSRIFDLGFHRDGAKSVTFLTMELLPGETLAARVSRVGRLTTAEALPIVAQMASALDAAHEAGIVHRDFKSGNVMLVETEKGVRAVVTDFGLARGSAGKDGFAASMTGTGAVAGTPLYMAPEQVEGGEVTASADIYALGVVMYEMVTGKWPFVGDSAISTAVKRLKEPPPSPRTSIPDLDRKWEAAILRCLERDPANRFARATDVVQALGGETVRAGRRQRRALLAVVAALLLVAAGLGYYLARRSGPAGPVKVRRSVAVLGFKNLAGRPEEAWLSAAFSEMLTTELAAGEKLRTISGENVARAKLELALNDAESLAGDTLARIRKNLGTDFVVLGSYVSLGKETGGQIRLDVRVQDAASGETLASLAQTGTESNFLDLVSQTGSKLRERLGVGELSAAQAGGARASLPSSSEGARLYAEGLARLRVFDALGARDLLEKAVAADPQYPMAHAALAASWSTLGYDGKAREQARKAFDLSGNLWREDRLAVEGRYRETVREWDKAVEIYRTLWGFFPDNLEYGLRLAAVELAAGSRKDSLATAESLRKLPTPASEDARIDLALARAAGSLSDYKREQAAAESASRKADAAGARLLAAEARLSRGDAAASLGDPKRAVVLFEEARQTSAAAGDRGGVARALQRIGTNAYRQGDLKEARAFIEQALAICRESGNEGGEASALNDLANIAGDAGDNEDSKRIHERVLELQRRLGNQRGVAGSLGNIASILQYQGDMAGSLRKHEESLAILRELGEKSAIAVEVNNTGRVLATQGDLHGAQKMFEEALSLKKEIGNRSSMSFTLRDLGELAATQGDFAAAHRFLQESLSIREELAQAVRAAETRVSLAGLANEEGKPREAEALARNCAEVLAKEGLRDEQATALAALAEALAAQGKLAEAQKEISAARAVSAKSDTLYVRFAVRLAAGRVDLKAGHFPDAGRELRAALEEARRGGMYGEALEARLALAQTDLRSGKASAGRARLEELEKDAQAKGFLLIARKAAAARG